MAAITADTLRRERAINDKVYDTATIVTAATVYVGALISTVIASGRVQGSASSVGATTRFAGIVTKIIDQTGTFVAAATGNTAGTVKCEFAYGHEVELPVKTSNATFSNVQGNVFAFNNGTVCDATAGGATAGARVHVGQLVSLSTTTDLGWVALRRYAYANAIAG